MAVHHAPESGKPNQRRIKSAPPNPAKSVNFERGAMTGRASIGQPSPETD
jgi:hypothetical protein